MTKDMPFFLFEIADTKRIYTNGLLQLMAQAPPSTMCSFPPCTNKTYNGTGKNPFHACAKHRIMIRASLTHQHRIYREFLKENAVYEDRDTHAFRKVPAEYCTIQCVSCRQKFERLKSRVIDEDAKGVKNRRCPLCNDSKVINIRCARCKKYFWRLKSRVLYCEKYGIDNAYCPSCGHKEKTFVTLGCDYCHKKFKREKTEKQKSQKKHYRFTYCSQYCLKKARSKKIRLVCAYCKKSFLKPRWQYNKAKKLGCKRAFCPHCTKPSSYLLMLCCANCKQTFQRPRYKVMKESKKFFCSRKCQINYMKKGTK